jgi:hypothetical protein
LLEQQKALSQKAAEIKARAAEEQERRKMRQLQKLEWRLTGAPSSTSPTSTSEGEKKKGSDSPPHKKTK